MNPYKYKTPIQIRFKDIDMLGHLNSSVYFTFFEYSRMQYFNSILRKNAEISWSEIAIVVAKQEMEYKQQIVLEDNVFSYVWVSRTGTKSFDMAFSLVKEENGIETEVAKGMTVLVCINLKTNQTVVIPELWKEKMLSNSH